MLPSNAERDGCNLPGEPSCCAYRQRIAKHEVSSQNSLRVKGKHLRLIRYLPARCPSLPVSLDRLLTPPAPAWCFHADDVARANIEAALSV